MDADDRNMLKIQDELAQCVTRLIGQQHHSAFAVAAAMVKISLQIYRTALSDEEYHAMVDEISARRGQIAPLTLPSGADSPLH